MASKSKSADTAGKDGRSEALQEAAREARRLGQAWRDEVDGTHSSHHSDLRRTWADAAERVAEAIEALGRQTGASGQ